MLSLKMSSLKIGGKGVKTSRAIVTLQTKSKRGIPKPRASSKEPVKIDIPSKVRTGRLIVSMTTVPKRLKHITTVLARLFSYQSVEPDAIILNVPQHYASKSLGRPVIPPELATLIKRNPRIILNRRCTDLGPGTKLSGLEEWGHVQPQDLIVYLDDDQAYDRHMLKRHGDAHRTSPRHVFCSRGSVLGQQGIKRAAIFEPPMTMVDLAEGWGAVSVLAKNINLKEIKKQLEAARDTPALLFSDDVLFSNYFWSKGLTIRLLPSPAWPLGALKHSKDEGCLMDGRGGSIGGCTKERIAKAIQALPCALPFKGMHLKGYADKTPEERIMDGLVWLKRPTSFPPEKSRSLGVVLYAFSRPDYLIQVIESLKRNKFPPEHTHVFIDGMINAWSGEMKGDPGKIHECRSMVTRLLGRKVNLWTAACNYGVGLMQHFGMDMVLNKLGYHAAIFLEDDLVLSPNYIETLRSFIPILEASPMLSSVQGGYRKTEGARKDDLMVLDAQRHHVHYWGWLTTRAKYLVIKPAYDKATAELFGNVDYSHRNKSNKLHQWFVAQGEPPTHKSQDWVRDVCFRKAGMSFKLVCAMRRSAPIGEWGLHSSPQLFRSMGLDSSTDDLVVSPFNFGNYRILGPFIVRDDVPRLIARRFVHGGNGVDGAIVISTKPQIGPLPNIIIGASPEHRHKRNTALIVKHDDTKPKGFKAIKRHVKGEVELKKLLGILCPLLKDPLPSPPKSDPKPHRRVGRGRIR